MIIVVIGFFVVKGSMMNSKLLKVCAMVMLIVGAGDVMSMDMVETPRNSTSEGESQELGSNVMSKTSQLKVSGLIEARLGVEGFDGTKGDINLLEKDGKTPTPEENRRFDFSVDTNGINPKIKLEGVDGFEFETGQGWFITSQEGTSKLQVDIALKKLEGSNYEDKCWEGSASIYTIQHGEKNASWRLVFDPVVSPEQERGRYIGSVKVTIVSE